MLAEVFLEDNAAPFDNGAAGGPIFEPAGDSVGRAMRGIRVGVAATGLPSRKEEVELG